MKKLSIFIIGLILTSCSSYNPNFNVIFGSGFKNNLVDLTINKTRIIDKKTVSSDSITGFVGDTFIIYKNDSLSLLGKFNRAEKKTPMLPSRFINFILQIDGNPYYLQADLKNGGNILIEKHSYYHNVNLKQFKKNLKFE